MISTRTAFNTDFLGASASTLCAIHCVATPFLFVVQTCSVSGCCTSSAPTWWSMLDYAFIVISLVAVFFSAKHTAKYWMKPALYLSWIALTFTIVNEKMAWLTLSEYWKYVAAFVMVGLHLYNRKYCQCKEDKCCAS